jgi:hypothetical protein
MLHPNVTRRKAGAAAALGLLTCALFVAACGPSRRAQENRGQAGRPQPPEAGAPGKFNVAQMTGRVLLAVEVSVSAEGVRALGASVIRAPAKANSATPDLRVTARAGESVVADYTIADPRRVEIEGKEWKMLPEGRAFIYAPLSEGLTEFRIEPLPGRERDASKGGTLDARELARRACEGRTELEECRRVLGARPGASPSPQPSPRTPTAPSP